MFDLAFIAIAAIAILRATRHGLSAGFPLAAGLLVLLPGQLRIELPGALPELTVHRIILAILIFRWIQSPRSERPVETVHLTFWLGLWLATRAVSDLLSVTPGASLKDLLAFAIEAVLFVQLARAALPTAEVRLATLRAVVVALFFVALIAFVERYGGVNLPVLVFAHFKYCYDGIQSTYPHRILLGYAMAMGVPLALFLIDRASDRRARRPWWLILVALVVACFLADSRGGWIGMALAGALSFLLGSGPTRRRCLALLVLALLTLGVRPGVRETILSRIHDTYAADSYKGTSYQYRWRLWHVAASEIARSPDRLLFGYGGLSTESMDLSRYFDKEQGGTAAKIGYTSWDNHYASDLIEFGVVGLGVEALVYAAIILQLLRGWRRASPEERPLVGATLIGCLVFMFARTNVYVFGEQTKFLFWTFVSLGAAAARLPIEIVDRDLSAPATPLRPVQP